MKSLCVTALVMAFVVYETTLAMISEDAQSLQETEPKVEDVVDREARRYSSSSSRYRCCKYVCKTKCEYKRKCYQYCGYSKRSLESILPSGYQQEVEEAEAREQRENDIVDDYAEMVERAQSGTRKNASAANRKGDAGVSPEVQNYRHGSSGGVCKSECKVRCRTTSGKRKCTWDCDRDCSKPKCKTVCKNERECGRKCGYECSRRKRRSIRAAPEESDLNVKLLGSDAELKLYDSSEHVRQLMETPVVRADLYERPLAPGVSLAVNTALRGKQSGVVATLSDGRHFFFVKGDQMGGGKETVIILPSHLTDDWVKTATKKVRSSTMQDFLDAGGNSFDLETDNGNLAAARMMELP